MGALSAPTSMALTCRWRSRPQHHKPTYAVPQICNYSITSSVRKRGRDREFERPSQHSSHRPYIDSILIVPAYPFHREFEEVLIATFWHKIEELVGTIDHVNAPPVTRIGVEHFTSLILVKDTDSLLVRYINRPNLIVVVRLTLGDLFGRKRHVIIEIEIASVGGDPPEAPAHVLLVSVDLSERSARNDRECHIAIMEMNRDAVEIVGPERARLASLFPIGAEHEVIDDQLGAPVEEIGERKGAIRPLELVGLFYPLPGHRHSAARQRIPLAREFLLGSEQFKASLQPFLVRDHFVIEHERLLLMSDCSQVKRAR